MDLGVDGMAAKVRPTERTGSTQAAPQVLGQRRYAIEVADPANYSTRRVMPLRHNLESHPLLQLPRLQQLAESLIDKGQCKFLLPGVDSQTAPFKTLNQNPAGRSIADIFEHIEVPGSWISLYNVETDPEYREFLWKTLESVRHLVDPQEPGMFNVGGFIFISAPPSVTPFHIDRENNFWLQIRGRKHTNVWQPDDRVTVSEDAVEDFIVAGDLRKVILRTECLARSVSADMGPGEGMYMPSTSAHMTKSDRSWVTEGDEVAVSIALVFYTEVTRRSARVYALNKFLRRFGVPVVPPGVSAGRDNIKYAIARSAARVRKLLPGG